MAQTYDDELAYMTFADIFPDYDSFKGYTDDIGCTSSGTADEVNELLYQELYFAYYNTPIAYDLIDNFKRSFGAIYRNLFRQYKARRKAVDAVFGLTLSDFLENGQVITNTSTNGEETVENQNAPIKYVTAQNCTFNNLPKLSAYLTAVNNMPDEFLQDFVDSFRFLFQLIYIPQDYFVDA